MWYKMWVFLYFLICYNVSSDKWKKKTSIFTSYRLFMHSKDKNMVFC